MAVFGSVFSRLGSSVLAATLGLTGLGLGLTALQPPVAHGAEAFSVRATGPLVFTLSVDSLETFAETGEATGNFKLLARLLNDEALAGLRPLLQFRFPLDVATVGNLSYSSLGRDVMTNMGIIFQSTPDENGFYAMRAAVINAAAKAGPEGWTLIDVMREFPSQSIHVNLQGLMALQQELAIYLSYNQAAVRAIQKQRADLLTETCRTWLQVTTSEVQRAKLLALLEPLPTVPEQLQTIERILAKLFIPAFQGTQSYLQILQRSQQLMTPGAGSIVQSLGALTMNRPHPGPPHLAWAGLLLVDAENMHPPKTLEAFLQTVGRYPILHRLAFGNWRRLGRRDQVFYQRGYQMVNVPSGKNSADIKMSLDASLISLWNPSIREVFICSTDSDLLHLGHTLLNLGVTPYRVSHRHNSFAILNVAQQTTQMFHLAPLSSPPEPSARCRTTR